MKTDVMMTELANAKHSSYNESDATVYHDRSRHTYSKRVTKKEVGDVSIHVKVLLTITKKNDTPHRLYLNPELSIKDLYSNSLNNYLHSIL